MNGAVLAPPEAPGDPGPRRLGQWEAAPQMGLRQREIPGQQIGKRFPSTGSSIGTSRSGAFLPVIAALLKDLDRKGLLKVALGLWGDEFGRTPTAEGTDGREHHPFGFTTWLAGAGVKAGQTSSAGTRSRTRYTSTVCTRPSADGRERRGEEGTAGVRDESAGQKESGGRRKSSPS
jgi:hypothetical protein